MSQRANWTKVKEAIRLRNSGTEVAFPKSNLQKPLPQFRKPPKQKKAGYSPLVWELRNREAHLLAANGKLRMTLQELIAHFGGSGKKSGQYIACNCPTMKHPERDNHKLMLAASTKTANRTYIKCLDGCTVDEILAAAGLQYKDLFNSPPDAPPELDPILFHSVNDQKNEPNTKKIVERIQRDIEYMLEWGTRDSRSDLLRYLRKTIELVDQRTL